MPSAQELQFIIKMQDQASSVLNSLGASFDKAGASAKNLASAGNQGATGLQSIAQNALGAAGAIGALVTSIVGISGGIAKFAEAEQNMIKFQRATKLTGDALAEYKTALASVSKEVSNVSGRQLSEFATAAAKLGVTGAQNLANFAGEMGKLQAVFQIGTEGAQAIGQILRESGSLQKEGVQSLKDFSNALTTVASHSVLSANELINLTRVLGASTGEFDISDKKLLGFAASFGDLVPRVRQAVTVFSQSMHQLSEGTSGASGGIQRLQAILGETQQSFLDLQHDDPSGLFIKLLEGVKKLQDQGKSSKPLLEQFGLGTGADQRVIQTLARNIDLVKAKLAEATDTKGNAGATDRENQKIQQTTQAQLDALSKSFSRLSVQAGAALAPLFNLLTEGLTHAINTAAAAFNLLPGPIQTLTAAAITGAVVIKSLGAALSVLAPLLGLTATSLTLTSVASAATSAAMVVLRVSVQAVLLSMAAFRLGAISLAGSLGVLRAAIVTLSAAGGLSALFTVARIAMAAFAAAVGGIVGPIGLAIAGVAALAAAIYDHWGELVSWLRGNKAEVKVDVQPAKKGDIDKAAQAAQEEARKSKIASISVSDENFKTLSSLNPALNDIEKFQKMEDALQGVRAQLEELYRTQGKADGIPLKNGGVLSRIDIDRANAVAAYQRSQRELVIPDQIKAAQDQLDAARARTGDQKANLEITQKRDELAHTRGIYPFTEEDAKYATDFDPEGSKAANTYLNLLKQIQAEKKATSLINLDKGYQDQIASAKAVTAAQKEQLEVTKTIRDLNLEVTKITEQEAAKIAAGVAAVKAAEREAAYDEELRQLSNAIELARTKNTADRENLQIQQQITEFERQRGALSPKDRSNLQGQLQAKSDAEAYKSLQSSVDPVAQATEKYTNDVRILNEALRAGTITAAEYKSQLNTLTLTTQNARDPYAAQLRSIKEATQATQLNGQYYQEDIKSLQTITQLENQGLQLTKQQKDALIDANRALKDMQKEQTSGLRGFSNSVTSIKDGLLDTTKKAADGLADAIIGAATRAQRPWHEFALGLAKDLARLGINNILKQLIEGLSGLSIGGSSLGSIFGLGGTTIATAATKSATSTATTGGGGLFGGLFGSSTSAASTQATTDAVKRLAQPTQLVGTGAGATPSLTAAYDPALKAVTTNAFGGGIDRSRFQAELDADPALKQKVLAISAGENQDPVANQAVMESMMNRAAMMKTPLAFEARTTGEGGYYAGYNPAALNNPAYMKMAEGNLDKVLKGSNVSNYATDNASGQFAADRVAKGLYGPNSTYGGESFLHPTGALARGTTQYPDWRATAEAQQRMTTVSADDLQKRADVGAMPNAFTNVTSPDQMLQQQQMAQKALDDQMKETSKAMTSLESPIKSVGESATATVPQMQSMDDATVKLATSLANSASTAASSSGGLLAGLFHAGGIVGAGTPASGYRSVSAGMFRSAPRFHTGLTSSEYPAILQRGERVLTASQNDRTMNVMSALTDRIAASQQSAAVNNASRMSKPFNQNITVYAQDANSFRKSSSQLMADSAVQARRVTERNS
jgi:hypothetical protein